MPDSAGAAGATEGEWITVRVVRAAQSGKGPRLTRLPDTDPHTGAPTGPPTGPARLLRRGPDAVARMADRYPEAKIEADDLSVLAELRPLFGDRLRRVPAAFDDTTEAAVEALADQDAALPGGARMTIVPTPALIAIDVDLSSGVSGRGGKSLTHMDANAAILPALARAIRLRNLGGAIVVDLAGLSPRRRAALGTAFAAAVAEDPVPTRFLGFSALGLAELLRDRIHPPLHELLASPHASGLEALRTLAKTIAADPRTPSELTCAPAIAEALERDASALADLARLAGRPLILRVDRTMPGA